MNRRLALVAAGLGLAVLAGGVAVDQWIDRTALPVVLSETSVEVRDRHGAMLRAYPVEDGIWRLGTSAAQVDPGYLDMLIRYEDKRFRSHAGVDPVALVRAAGQSLMAGRTVSGGSTLTMQVARLLENGRTGTWSGKLRQLRVALALERRLSKDQILDLYLTHAPFGGNLEGVRAASLAWFGKEPRRLTPAEAALLVALPQAPEGRRPDRNSDRALAARERVLDRVARQSVLPESDRLAAMGERLPQAMRPFPRFAPHLADAVRAADRGKQRHDLTLDAGVQAALETLLSDAARRAGEQVSGALVVADIRSAEIIASVGSAGYDDADARQGFVDMTRALRSPGSTLKPLIYGLAFDQGLAHPESLIHDGPMQFGRYAPQNFDGAFRGDVRVREALQLSLNIPVVKLTNALGPVRVLAAMRQAGAEPRLPGGKPGLAIALGGLGVSLRDLVQLYASMAAGGQGPRLRHDLSAGQSMGEPIMSDVAAWHVGHILSGLTPPPGSPADTIAYKTGTSYGHRDAWAIGWDGGHVIGVWMGRADGTPVPGAFGGELAAPVLFEAFGRVKPGFDPLPPPPPETLILTAAELPQPLRRFGLRSTARTAAPNRLQLVFPPDGARLETAGGMVTLKLRGGRAPYSVLADGEPVATGLRTGEIELPYPGQGFSTLVVLDSAGQSDRVTVRLD